MQTIREVITRVNDDEPMTEDEVKRAKLVLDSYAATGKTDVLQARIRVHKIMAERGIPHAVERPASKSDSPTGRQTVGNLAFVVGGLALIGGVVFLIATAGGDDKDTGGPDSSADNIGASLICETFMERELRSPGTADFAGYGSQTVTGGPNRFVVDSYVDSENGFGALLRTTYTCTVTSTDGENWNLVDLATS